MVFVAGSWEDVLPGIEAPWSSSSPIADGDEETGLRASPLEQILVSGFDVAALIQIQVRLFQSSTPTLHPSIVVQRIPHVPKPALHV